MGYGIEVEFVKKALSHFRIETYFISDIPMDVSEIDLGLRHLLGMGYERFFNYAFIRKEVKPNIIYKLKDPFYCNYYILQLPFDTDKYMLIGPYTTKSINREDIMHFSETYSLSPQIYNVLEKIFYNIPYLENETVVLVLLNTFGELLWGSIDHFTFENLDHLTDEYNFLSAPPFTHVAYEHGDASALMQSIEKRYDTENRLLEAISHGSSHKAELILSNLAASVYEKRSTDSIRNMQNYCIILNTLLRKAVESSTVHPFYIDKISSDFARRIEQVTSAQSGAKLQKDMVHKYCLLVKNHSMKGYSLLIQKVITSVDSDLTADLSLNTLAGNLNVNASYLSTLFKRETGSTLTDYVNEKRIQHGILLLHSTNLQIQTIAAYCGIPDVNYFTKLFKKKLGKTPKEYRENFLKGSRKK